MNEGLILHMLAAQYGINVDLMRAETRLDILREDFLRGRVRSPVQWQPWTPPDQRLNALDYRNRP